MIRRTYKLNTTGQFVLSGQELTDVRSANLDSTTPKEEPVYTKPSYKPEYNFLDLNKIPYKKKYYESEISEKTYTHFSNNIFNEIKHNKEMKNNIPYESILNIGSPKPTILLNEIYAPKIDNYFPKSTTKEILNLKIIPKEDKIKGW